MPALGARRTTLRCRFRFATYRREAHFGIQALPLQPFQFGQFKGKRRVASFGFRYDYALRRLRGAIRSPPGWQRLSRRSKHLAGPRPGSSRSSAPNTTSGSGSAGTATSPISIRCSAFHSVRLQIAVRRPAGKTWNRFTLNAEPRSLYMMSGASRQVWEHSIPPVEAPRYSITFRTMTNGPDLRTLA
jgi:hypothetical protein